MRHATLRTLPLLAGLLACTMGSQAATVIYTTNPLTASGINGLVVDGTTYNVSFAGNTADYTFLNNASGAADAANALIAALNSSTAAYVNTYGASNTLNVEDSSYSPRLGVSIASYYNVGGWQLLGSPTPSDAIFTVASAPTPEPSSLVLLGSGVLSMAGVARRRFFKQ